MTQSDLTARIDEHLARPVRPPVYVEIVDPSGRVSYRRWSDHPDVLEALGTQGYTVRRCPQQPELEEEAHPDRALLVESAARIRDLEAQLAAQAEAGLREALETMLNAHTYYGPDPGTYLLCCSCSGFVAFPGQSGTRHAPGCPVPTARAALAQAGGEG